MQGFVGQRQHIARRRWAVLAAKVPEPGAAQHAGQRRVGRRIEGEGRDIECGGQVGEPRVDTDGESAARDDTGQFSDAERRRCDGAGGCCCDAGGKKSIAMQSECTKTMKGKCVAKDQCK